MLLSGGGSWMCIKAKSYKVEKSHSTQMCFSSLDVCTSQRRAVEVKRVWHKKTVFLLLLFSAKWMKLHCYNLVCNFMTSQRVRKPITVQYTAYTTQPTCTLILLLYLNWFYFYITLHSSMAGASHQEASPFSSGPLAPSHSAPGWLEALNCP